METERTSQPIYRYKLAAGFQEELRDFAQANKHLEAHAAFRDAWNIWAEDNREILAREIGRLTDLGYQGSAERKIYKSARHYHRLRSQDRPEPNKRRKYVSLSRDILHAMDTHISEVAFVESLRPAEGYLDFRRWASSPSRRPAILAQTEEWLCRAHGYTAEDAEKKVKKTYKNRYFKGQKTRAEE